nr:MAG TPA: hypothetical protein [Caudoviricetes sp.]
MKSRPYGLRCVNRTVLRGKTVRFYYPNPYTPQIVN